MTTRILLAPPARGKTALCLQTVREALQGAPLAPVWVVAADYRQVLDYRRRLAALGGGLGVHIVTFGDLCREVAERAGQRKPITPPALAHRLVQAAIERAGLAYYAGLRGLPGFTLTVEAAIGELKRALVAPDRIRAFNAGSTEKNRDQAGVSQGEALGDLAGIYICYKEVLEKIGWIDGEGAAWEAIRLLDECPSLFGDCPLLVVDGFDGFNPAQRGVLKRLAGQVGEMVVTLPGPVAGTAVVDRHCQPAFSLRPVQRGFAPALMELLEDLEAEVAPLGNISHLPGALAYLEANLFEPGRPPYPEKSRQVALLEAPSPVEEAREALRFLKACIVRDRVPPGECAILAPDPDVYFPHLRAVAVEFGLPVSFTQSRLLTEAPAISALLNLLALDPLDYPRRQVLEALRAPFFDLQPFGLSRKEADVLDLVSRKGVIIEGLDQWREVLEDLKSHLEAPSEEEDPGEEMAQPALPLGAAAGRLQAAFETFVGRLRPPAEAQPVSRWVAWLEDLLEALGFCQERDVNKHPVGQPIQPGSQEAGRLPGEPGRDYGEESQQALAGLHECLRGLLLAETLLGAQPVDYTGFLAELQGLLQGSGYPEATRTSEATIEVMRPMEARGLRFQVVALVGLSEGIFPRVEHPDPLLDETTRAGLGLQPRLERNQLGLFYQAVTRPERRLLLTRPYLSESGDPWEPSPYWNAVQRLFPGEVRRVRPEDARPLAHAASAGELLFWAMRREGATGVGLIEEDFQCLRSHFEAIGCARQRLKALLEAPGASLQETPPPAVLADWIHTQFGPGHTWSVSRLECFAACPFRFFIEQVLGVEAHEAPGWDFDPAQLGSLLHAILERTYRETDDPTDEASLLARLRQVAPQEFAGAPLRYGFRASPLWAAQQAELMERLEGTLTSLQDQSDRWRPLRFEQPFGFKGFPPLIIPTEDGTARLHGVIDRIDINERGELRVIDYKVGGRHTAPRDLVEGRRLQLAVYALAVQKALGLGQIGEGFYWRIGPDGASTLKLSRFRDGELSGPAGAIELAGRHISNILRSLQRSEFPSQPLGGKCPDYCVIAPWCWRYSPEWG